MKFHRPLKALAFVVCVSLAIFLFGFVTMHLWNWLMPALFGLRSLSFTEALGLLILSRILFGGFHRHGGRGRGWKMVGRWNEMSPEEREKFRAGMRGRCGSRPSAPEAPAL